MSLKESGKGLFAEFKQFIARGNVIDLAVGVIIGAAFKSIVDSLTNDILMSFLGLFINESSFTALQFQVGDAVVNFGSFIQAVINFFIMALVIFFMVKIINRYHRKKKKEEAPPPPPEPSAEEKLLTEIRDLLKERQ